MGLGGVLEVCWMRLRSILKATACFLGFLGDAPVTFGGEVIMHLVNHLGVQLRGLLTSFSVLNI